MPRNTTSRKLFYYVYVMESIKDKKYYIGYTIDLRKRMEEHYKGQSKSTSPRRPLKLIYFEGCISQKDAKRREEYLKTTPGRRFLSLRLKEYRRPYSFGTRS